MIVLLFEDNLMWSAKLKKSLTALGHASVIKTKPLAKAESTDGADIAIVNLGSEGFRDAGHIQDLKAKGAFVIGHAGHKESELHQFGREAGCDRLATNSELTFKIEKILAEVTEKTKE